MPIDPERLLAQTAWVRRLARSLARDEASADDLAQESFAAALRRPPAGETSDARLEAWFGRVLRNLALRGRRSELRRARRERQGARAERSEADARAAELEELRAELYRHVQALAAPEREVVLLGYFEELDAPAIARRLGLPDSTVRNRLRRALAELRERMERAHGSEWRNLCLFVLPRPPSGTLGGSAAVAGTSAALAAGWWLAGGTLALAALLAWIAWPRNSDAGRPRLPEPVATRDPAGATQLASSSSSASARRAQAAPEEARPAGGTTSLSPARIHVRGRVLDEHGAPAGDWRMCWYDARGAERRPEHGYPDYQFFGIEPGAWIAALSGAGWQSEQTDLVVAEAPAEQVFDFVVRPTLLVPVFLVDESGAARLPGPGVEDPIAHLIVVASTAPLPAELARLPREGNTLGSARFFDRYTQAPGESSRPEGAFGMLELRADPPLEAAVLDGTHVLARQRLRDRTQELRFVLPRREIEERRAAWSAGLRIKLARSDGSPLAPAERVLLGWPWARPVQIDSEGRIEARDLEPGPFALHLRVPKLGRIDREVLLHAGRIEDLGELRLEPERMLRICFDRPDDAQDFVRFRLQRLREGQPLLTLADPEGIEQRAFRGGSATLPCPNEGRYLLRVMGIGQEPPPGEELVRNDYHAGARPLVLELSPASPPEVHVRIEPTTRVVLRPPREAQGTLRWLLATDEDLPCRVLATEGRAPLPLDLVPGGYTLAALDEWSGALGPLQVLRVGTEALLVELVR